MKKVCLSVCIFLFAFSVKSQIKYNIQNKSIVNKIAKQLEIRSASYDLITGNAVISISLNSIDSVGNPGEKTAYFTSLWEEVVSASQNELGNLTLTAALNWVLSKYGLTLSN